MVDKNDQAPSDSGSGSVAPIEIPDLPDPDQSESVASLTVTNEEMAEHLKLSSSGTSTEPTALAASLDAQSLPRPADKYLPPFELDFRDEPAEGNPPEARKEAQSEGGELDSQQKESQQEQEQEPENEPEHEPELEAERAPEPETEQEPAPDGQARPESPAVEAEARPEVEEYTDNAPGANGEPAARLEQITGLAEEIYENPAELDEFKSNLETFEKRAEEWGLTEEDKQEFYGQVERVLKESKTGNDFYSSDELRQAASDMVLHAAKPGTVNQGSSSTCTAAALETVLYIQEPATIARLVADVALTGRYEKADGSIIEIPEKNLRPNKYQADTPADKKRSLASHMAQPQLINIHWSGQDEYAGESGKGGRIRYEEGYPSAFFGDSHTRMMDYSKSPPEPFTEKKGYQDPTDTMSGIYHEVLRPVEGPSMYMEYLPDLYKQLRGNKGDLTIVNRTESPGVIKPESAAHFRAIMADAHERKKPVLLGVHANRDPFLADLHDSYSDTPLTDEQRERQAGEHAHHALVATVMELATGLVTVENQWGNKVDHTGVEGQREKMPVDTVYDTIVDKQADPEAKPNERPAPEPEDYIKQQKEFVAELDKDEDVDPRVMLHERLKLHKYLSHWGHKEEAHEQAELIASSITDRLKSDEPDGNIYFDVQQFMYGMRADGEKELSEGVLQELDKRFEKKTPSGDHDYLVEFEAVLKMHDIVDDKEGASRLGDNVVTRLLKDPQDITNEKTLFALGNVYDKLNYNGLPEVGARISDNVLSNIRTYEKTHGSDNREVVRAKRSLLYMGKLDVDNTLSMSKQIAAEMQQSYDRVKGDVHSELAHDLRMSLSSFYEMAKNPEALNDIIQDNFKYLAVTPGRDGELRDPDAPEFIDIYQYSARRLEKAGGHEYAIPMMEKALKIAQERKPEEVTDIATRLVYMLDHAGRSADGDKLASELGIEVPFRRRQKAMAK